MADNLIYPIGFDLEKAVNDAGKDWNDKYADKLEKLIAKKPVNVKLKLDVTQLDSLDKVKERLAQLKIEPITPQTKAAIEELAGELRTLAKALEQVQKFSAGRAAASPDAVRAARINEINTRAEAKAKVEAEKAAVQAAKAEKLLADARLKDARAAKVNVSSTKEASAAYGGFKNAIHRAANRLAAYWSIRQVGNFLTSVREVTAQFELQRVSLGAIIQDQQRANALFSEIKSFALKSPVSIMDLTKYTKQLAAYKIETEELFETTKKLTDVSVGLGVSMDRVVLAYGQVRARGALYASEIRQFTEMGVPIVEELAAKLSKMNGELVTSKDVLDLVSKGAISFELVKEVFDDMTSAGGMFYNMQEKQGNTLFGLWAKLGDAASVMYDQIGNTESMNKGMKEAIQLLTELMKNWRAVSAAMSVEAIGAGMFLLGKKAINKGAAIEAEKVAAATRNRVKAQAELNTQLKIGTQADIAAARAALQKAQADEKAAISASKNVTAIGKLKTGLLSIGKSFLTGLGWGAVIALVSTLVFKIADAVVNAGRLKKALDGIASETGTSISRMVTNFESLANKAVKAADGSKEQKDALSELQRTYKNIIPEQELTIEKLREMKGEYTNLTIAIREYIRQQQLQKGLDTISEEYGKKVVDAERELRENLKNTSFESKDGAVFALDEAQIDRIISLFKKLVLEGKSAQEALQTAFQYEGLENLADRYTEIADKLGLVSKAQLNFVQTSSFGGGYYVQAEEQVTGLTKALQDQIKAENDWKKQIDDAVPALGALTKYFEDAKKKIEEHTFVTKENTLAYDVETAKMQIDAYLEALKEALDASGVKIDLGKYITVDAQGIKNFDFAAFGEVLSGIDSQFKVPLINLTGEIKKIYDGFVPSDPVAIQIRSKFMEIADSMGAAGDKMRNYLWNGQGALSDHIKSLTENVTKYEAEIYRMNAAIAKGGFLGWLAQITYGEKIEEYNKIVQGLTQLVKFEQSYVKEEDKKKKKGGTKSDPRLQILNEMVQLAEKLNKEYSDWEKKVGSTKALEKVNETYAETVKYAEKVAKDAGISLPHLKTPTNAKELNEYLEAVRKVMETAKGLKGGKKAAIELAVKMSNNVSAEDQKAIEEKIKALADQISRTKTAQEFYDRILGSTGDIDLAASVTMSIYGDAGTDVQGQMAEYISQLFGSVELEVPVSIITSEDVIDYTALEKFAMENKKILGDSYKELIKIAQDGQKDMAKTYEGYLKDLEVAKTYADKRVELARDTANNIVAIEKTIAEAKKKLAEAEAQGDTKEADRQRDVIKSYEGLPQQYRERESREAAKLEYEAFKDTPLYTQMFEDLDYASSSALTRMRDRLVALKGQWKNLDPKNIKEMQKRWEEIDSQLAARNPFKTLADAYKKWRDMRKSGRTKEGDEVAAVNAEKERKAAWDNMMADQKDYKFAVKTHGEKSKEAQAAREAADASKEAYENAEKGADEAANNANEWKKIADKARNAAGTIRGYTEKINEAAEGIRGMLDAFGASDEDKQFFEDIVGGFNKISKGGEQAAESFARFSSGDIFGGITAGVGAVGNIVSGFTDLFSAGRVRKANKEIKRQQELLEQLQYTYSRLEYAADKAFGSDYVNNYQQQIKNLQAQQQAYLKQAQAERSKGKDEDKEKTKEYENAARDTADEIKKMQDELVAHFTGSSKTDIARQMAKSWIDARASMSDTFAAIKSDYADMVKNMLVEGAAARVIENALTPVWNSMQKMLDKNDVQGAIDSLVNGMDAALSQANNGMEVLWQALEARGYDMKKMLGTSDTEMTGIKREIATASEESITGLAAAINTQNYYISHVPQINENVAAIRALLETGSGGALPAGTATGWTDWQQQAMDNYNAIARNTAETVAECRRSAQACESIATQFSRIIKVKGSVTGVNTFLNS